jgi:hypothetical protein
MAINSFGTYTRTVKETLQLKKNYYILPKQATSVLIYGLK